MDITIEKLLAGKATRIKNKDFFPTSDYVSPFIEEMSRYTDNFKVQVRLPSQVTVTDDEDDLTYNRVWVQAVLPEKHCIENHKNIFKKK